jgi:(2Fe-2S) ferredoxin
MAKRNHYLFVCTNRRADDNPKGSCASSGSEQVLDALKQALFARGLAKAEARACGSTCLDVCHLAPAIAVEPDGFFYGHVTKEDVPEIVEALATGGRVERLVVRDDRFEAPPVAKPPKA